MADTFYRYSDSPTYFGDIGGKTYAFSNEADFKKAGGNFATALVYNQATPTLLKNAPIYGSPTVSPSVISSNDARTATQQNVNQLNQYQSGIAQSQANQSPASSTVPQFYKPDQNNQTLFNAQGQPISYDQYIAQGGKPDFSNVVQGAPSVQLSTTGVTDPALLASINAINQQISSGQYPGTIYDVQKLNSLGTKENLAIAKAKTASDSKNYFELDQIMKEIEQIRKDRQTLIDKVLGGMQQTDEEKRLSQEINNVTQQERETGLRVQAGLQATEQKLIPMQFISGESDRLIKQANLQLQTLATQKAPLIDQLSAAQNTRLEGLKVLEFALQNLGEDQNMLLKMSDYALELDKIAKSEQEAAKEFALNYSINKPFYEFGGTVYRTSDGKAYSSAEQAGQDGVDTMTWGNVYKVDSNSQVAREIVAKWAEEYADSGILPSDSMEVARTKLEGSAKYRKQVSNSSGSGSSGTSTEIDNYAQAVYDGEIKITGVPQKLRDEVLAKVEELKQGASDKYETEFEARVDYNRDLQELAGDVKAGTQLPAISEIIKTLTNDYGSKISKQEIEGAVYDLFNVSRPVSVSNGTVSTGSTKLHSQESYKQSQANSQLNQYKQRADDIIARYKASKDSAERARLKRELANIPQRYGDQFVHNGL